MDGKVKTGAILTGPWLLVLPPMLLGVWAGCFQCSCTSRCVRYTSVSAPRTLCKHFQVKDTTMHMQKGGNGYNTVLYQEWGKHLSVWHLLHTGCWQMSNELHNSFSNWYLWHHREENQRFCFHRLISEWHVNVLYLLNYIPLITSGDVKTFLWRVKRSWFLDPQFDTIQWAGWNYR